MMERKKKIRIIEILLLIVIIITTFIIGDTYSKYKEQINTYYRVDMKKWYFKVNDKDIYSQSSLIGVLEPTYVETEYVNDNILVPGREMYFDMNVDYSKTNVKFDMVFRIQVLNNWILSDFKIYKYIGPDGEVALDPLTNSFTITIDPTEDTTTTSTDVRAYIKWNDDENSQVMDNLADIKYKGETVENSDNTKLKFKVTTYFIQVL